MARRWIKLWVDESLDGTIRFDFDPAERGVWFDILLLAGRCRQEGLISPGHGQAYPHNWIAGRLNISLELLEGVLAKCKTSGRISENSNGIKILNWNKYQSEYERQKPYREKKKGKIEPPTEKENEMLGTLKSMPGWKLKLNDDILWLRQFLSEYPQATLDNLKGCQTYFSDKPATKGPWKNRLIQWMKHEQVYKSKHGQVPKVTKGKELKEKWGS